MKTRLLLITVLSLFAAAPIIQAADDKAHKEEHTPLEEAMEKINSAFRKLRRAPGANTPPIADPAKNEESLKQLAIIREQSLVALKHEPKIKSEKPADQQAKLVAAYQAQMKDFIALVEKAEAALKAGNNEEAARLVSAMNDAQKKGHGDFRKKKKE